jgi:hypothetical protein
MCIHVLVDNFREINHFQDLGINWRILKPISGRIGVEWIYMATIMTSGEISATFLFRRENSSFSRKTLFR